jgi:rod shape-determining protein MreC
MFSKKTIVIAGAIILVTLNIIVFSFHLLLRSSILEAAPRVVLVMISPIQEIISSTLNFSDNLWKHYFDLISVARQNNELKKMLAVAIQQNNSCEELRISNERLRKLVELKDQIPFHLIAAEVIAKDPSPWYQTIVINKGKSSGVVDDCPVIVSEGIVGHVLTSSSEYAKVLLIIDQNSSVDALIQRSRVRGIVEGISNDHCKLNYVLSQADVEVDDKIISSGFDGIYPKGLPIGRVLKIIGNTSGLFKDIEIAPFVDFSKLEEVMVILNPSIQKSLDDSCGS